MFVEKTNHLFPEIPLPGLKVKAVRSVLDDDQLTNAYRLSMGFQYIPDATSYNSYLKRAAYRAGISFGTDPRMINGEQIKQYELNLGIGLPVVVSRQLSFINLGLNYGRFGGNIPIKENIVGINVAKKKI